MVKSKIYFLLDRFFFLNDLSISSHIPNTAQISNGVVVLTAEVAHS